MSSEPKKKGKGFAPSIVLICVVAFVLVLVVVVYANMTNEDASTADPDQQTQQVADTTCPPFSVSGATCDVGTEGTAWIRPDASSPLPQGARYCWDNKPEEFDRIEYLVGGKTHVFNHADPAPQGAGAYRFFPKEPTTLVYNLATVCRSGT